MLADELGVSLRTVYRDLAALKTQGAPIEGEAGVGFVLRAGFTLPPLMFTEDELEALVLGARWVADRGDSGLGQAARSALVKIGSVLPPGRKDDLGENTLLIPGQSERPAVNDGLLGDLRQAVRANVKVEITYRDPKNQVTRRTVWPFAIAFYDQVLVVVTWCELREDFRNFRLDRIEDWTVSATSCPEGRVSLLRRWRETQGIPADWTADTF